MYYTTDPELLKLRKADDVVGLKNFIKSIKEEKGLLWTIRNAEGFNVAVMMGGFPLYKYLIASVASSTSIGIDYDDAYPLSCGGSRFILKNNIDFLKWQMGTANTVVFEETFGINTFSMLAGYNISNEWYTSAIKRFISVIFKKNLHVDALVSCIKANFISYDDRKRMSESNASERANLLVSDIIVTIEQLLHSTRIATYLLLLLPNEDLIKLYKHFKCRVPKWNNDDDILEIKFN